MSFKDFFGRLIRGWLPEEPKMPQTSLNKAQMQLTSHLRTTNSVKIVYGLTLGCASLVFLSLLIFYCWSEQTPSLFSVYLTQLPGLFLLNALPLSIFVVVFLTKGGGSHYFRSWNQKKKLQFSGLALLAGYITVMLPTLLNLQVFIPYGSMRHFETYYGSIATLNSIFVYLGLGIMAIGFVSMIRAHNASVHKEETGTQKPKTTKRTWVLAVLVIALSVSLVCLFGLHLRLQNDYDNLSESSQYATAPKAFIVNENWTDNTGSNSKYVTYSGTVINPGYRTAYNVTLLVNVYGNDDTVLKHEEIPMGDVQGPFGFESFNVNVEYSGELSHVSAGTRWD
jgi:hypothetical protein